MNYQLDDLDIQISNLANSTFFKLSKKIIEDARNIFIAQTIYDHIVELCIKSGYCIYNCRLEEDKLRNLLKLSPISSINSNNIYQPITMTREQLCSELKRIYDSLDNADKIQTLLKEIQK